MSPSLASRQLAVPNNLLNKKNPRLDDQSMTNAKIQLCLVLHNHQPVGNFDNVFEAAYQDSYLPFLDVFEPFEDSVFRCTPAVP